MNKKIANGLVALPLLLAALFGVGCQKDVSYRTNLVLKSWSQESSGDELRPVTDMLMYGFAADTSQYVVASYEDALAGVMTSKRDPAQKITAELSGSECFVEGYGAAQMMPAPDYASVILLAVNREEQLYGYTQLALAENLSYLYVSVRFQPWKESASYKDGQWWMFNDNYVANMSCMVLPKAQWVEQGEVSYLTNSRLFAYEVQEPEGWEPIDWNDAEVGRLTNSSTGEILDPCYSFSADKQGNLTAKFPPSDYLLMVVNASERCYALRPLSEQEILADEESEPEDRGFEVVFPLWNLDPPQTTDQGWRCYYTPSISTTVKTTIRLAEGESPEPLTRSTLYLYTASAEEQWLPSSLEAAASGVLTNPESGAQLNPEYSFPFGDESTLQPTFLLDDYLMMVVNKESSCYALRPFSRTEAGKSFNLEFTTVAESYPYLDPTGWQIYYTPNLKSRITTTLQQSQEQEPQPIAGSLLHAYRVENPELWLPKDLADARDGRLMSSQSGEFIMADYTFKANAAEITTDLPYGDYLVMVTNYEVGSYALRTLGRHEAAAEFTILFPLWQTSYPVVDQAGWQIYYTPNVRGEIELSVQFAEDQEPQPLDCAFLYAYQLESGDDWAPESLADALAGRLTNQKTGELAPIYYSYEAGRDETLLAVDFLQGDYLLMVTSSYGCSALRMLTTQSDQTSWELMIPLWRTDSPFTDQAGWSIYTWHEEQTPKNE